MAITRLNNNSASSITTLSAVTSVPNLASLPSGLVANTPAFRKRMASDQSLSGNAWTKIQFNETAGIDTDNDFDATTNYRFTPSVSGKYFIYSTVTLNGTTDFDDANISIYYNGSQEQTSTFRQTYYQTLSTSGIFSFNGSTDYVETYVYVPQAFNTYNGTKPVFGGFRIIE